MMTGHDVQNLGWFVELKGLVQKHFERGLLLENEQQPQLQEELGRLDEQARGWSISLANSQLASSVREVLETQLTAALARKTEIEARIDERTATDQRARTIVDEQEILDRLQRLDQLLSGDNATLTNIELALHIDRIECSIDGKVRMRMCKLGCLHQAVDLIADLGSFDGSAASESCSKADSDITKPRRLGRRRYFNQDQDGVDARATADFTAEPQRFAGLPDEFFWIDEFQLPEKKCWSDENAESVYRYWKAESGRSKTAVGIHFGKSKPTIRRAIKIAEERMAAAANVAGDTIDKT